MIRLLVPEIEGGPLSMTLTEDKLLCLFSNSCVVRMFRAITIVGLGIFEHGKMNGCTVCQQRLQDLVTHENEEEELGILGV